MSVALCSADVRSELLLYLRQYVEAVAPDVAAHYELRHPVTARVLSDLTDCYQLEGAAGDAAKANEVAEEARLRLVEPLWSAGLGQSLGALLVAARRAALRRLKAPQTLADYADGAGASRDVSLAVDLIATGRESEMSVPTGLRALDELINGGLPRGEIALVGAPTGAGKTTIAMQIAEHAAKQDRGLVLVVSPEMQARDLWLRLAQREANVSRRALRRSNPGQDDAIARVTGAAALMAQRTNLVVLDRVDADLSLAMQAAEQLHETRGPLYLLVLDYAQQLASIDGKADARYLEVGRVATRALALAVATGAAVLITSQVNTVKGKDGGVVDVTFRESALLEQKAAVAMTLKAKREDNRMEVHLRKNRHGALNTLELYYRPEVFLVGDLDAGA